MPPNGNGAAISVLVTRSAGIRLTGRRRRSGPVSSPPPSHERAATGHRPGEPTGRLQNPYYDRNSQSFCDRTLGIDMSHLHQGFLRNLAPGAHILDLGCGMGRDTKAFLDAGYAVTALDASRPVLHSSPSRPRDAVRRARRAGARADSLQDAARRRCIRVAVVGIGTDGG